MSYDTWNEHGYGFCTDMIGEVPIERLEALIHMAPSFEKEINAWLEESEITVPTADDYYEFDQDQFGGLAAIIKSVIQEVEGLELLYCDDFDGKKYLLFAPVYPWLITESEKGLTEERLDEIYKKYVSLLTDTPVAVEYQSVANGG